MREIVELQLLQGYQAKAERVASDLQGLVARDVRIDCDKLGFWLDLLSDDQLRVLWKNSDEKTRKVVLDSLLDETKDALELEALSDYNSSASSSSEGKGLTLSELHGRWKERYSTMSVASDPKDYTLMQGGRRGRKVLPNARFNEYDVRRIKAVGPMFNDVVLQQWDLPAKSASGKAKKVDAIDQKGGRDGERKTRDQEIEAFNTKRAYQDERFQFLPT